MQPDHLEPAWRALSNPLRRQMLDILRESPLPTGALGAHFPGHSRFAVMQHLRVLEEGGLVVRRKEGRLTINHLNPVPIQQIHDRWVTRYERHWTEALLDLKAQLETPAASDSAEPGNACTG